MRIRRVSISGVVLCFAVVTTASAPGASGVAAGRSAAEMSHRASQKPPQNTKEKPGQPQKTKDNPAKKQDSRGHDFEVHDQDHDPQMRFKGMDRNNDGRISRAEWRGNDVSFANHDWNEDGVLSGDEVRPGGRRQGGRDDDFGRDERFDELDHNNDGRLGRGEWRGSPARFQELDGDKDAFLTRREFVDRHDGGWEGGLRDLDHNDDGRIERQEWHGQPKAFDRLDVNHDGVLTREDFGPRGSSDPRGS